MYACAVPVLGTKYCCFVPVYGEEEELINLLARKYWVNVFMQFSYQTRMYPSILALNAFCAAYLFVVNPAEPSLIEGKTLGFCRIYLNLG